MFTEKVAPFIEEMFEAHDLNGVLQFVFDASSAGWNLSSTNRASALLRRALAWCSVLKLLVSQQWNLLPSFYRAIYQFDADVACWVSEQLHEIIGDDKRYRKPLFDLYSSVVLGSGRPDVRTMAASNLASMLEKILSSQPNALSSIDLPWEAILHAFKPETEIETWNRDATDAELRLRGCLLAIRTILNQDTTSSTEIRNWTIKLRSALSEETVSQTFAWQIFTDEIRNSLRASLQPHLLAASHEPFDRLELSRTRMQYS